MYKIIKKMNTSVQNINGSLNSGQLAVLKVMARPISNDDLKAIKKLIVKYFADKLADRADEIWEQNNWSEKEEEDLLKAHFRTPYQ